MKQMTEQNLLAFRAYLTEGERSKATVDKYGRDIRNFYEWLPPPKELSKDAVIAYKNELMKRYAINSVNSMVCAVNHFLRFMEADECVVKTVRRQRRTFCGTSEELSKEEYLRLVERARSRGNKRLALVMETICSTGIRVSELVFITVEAARCGRADVALKGKIRSILLPKALCISLNQYIEDVNRISGPVFLTRSGQPLDRSNIWKEMKKLCRETGVDHRKVFPHNLRHLFARTYYALEKDLGCLADLLGHSCIETTRIYTMTTGIEQAERLDGLGLLFCPPLNCAST